MLFIKVVNKTVGQLAILHSFIRRGNYWSLTEVQFYTKNHNDFEFIIMVLRLYNRQ